MRTEIHKYYFLCSTISLLFWPCWHNGFDKRRSNHHQNHPHRAVSAIDIVNMLRVTCSRLFWGLSWELKEHMRWNCDMNHDQTRATTLHVRSGIGRDMSRNTSESESKYAQNLEPRAIPRLGCATLNWLGGVMTQVKNWDTGDTSDSDIHR